MAVHELRPIDSVIKAAKHLGRGRETEYRIVGNQGLVLVVQITGAKSWRFYYSFTRGGRRQKRKMALGRYPLTSLADARAKAAELAKRVEHEGDVVAREKTARLAQQVTLRALVEEVLTEQGGLASAAEKARELRKDLLPALGACRPDQVRPEDVDRVARSVSERGASAQARRIIMHVKSIYNYVLLDRPTLAQKYGVISNPAATLARRRTSSAAYPASAPRKRVLTDAELAAVWPALRASAMAPRTRLVLQLTLATAQRHGEVRHIQPRHLALNGPEPIWVIPRLCTKTKLHDHAVPLSPLAVALLREALELHRGEPTDWLFPAPGNAKSRLEKTVPATALAHFRKTRLPAMEPFTPHDMRRTAATGMRRIGVTGEIVKLILNHARHDVTGRHYDLYEALPERRHALCVWARYIEQLGTD